MFKEKTLKPTKHFIQRMKERKISVEQVMDILKNGIAKFPKHKQNIVEIVKNKIKIIIDITKRKLITIFHINERFAHLYNLVDDLENFVYAKLNKTKKNDSDDIIIDTLVMPLPRP